MGKKNNCFTQQVCSRCGFRTVQMARKFYHSFFCRSGKGKTWATGVPQCWWLQLAFPGIWCQQSFLFLFSSALFKSLVFELHLLKHIQKLPWRAAFLQEEILISLHFKTLTKLKESSILSLILKYFFKSPDQQTLLGFSNKMTTMP